MHFLKRISNESTLLWVALVLLIPALLLNLGLIPPWLHVDEARRAQVALEMIYSGDYLTPTLNGELYFNKPPLYNWVVALFFLVTKTYSAFVIRLPSLTGFIIHAWLVYYFTRRFTGNKRLAIFSSLALVTCGRVFFYDSFLGLIDLSFGAVMFLNFMLVYENTSKGRWLRAFLLSYILMSLAYLMKGLPAIAFQGISIIVATFLAGQPRKLFSWKHIAGILTAMVILGGYYLLYLDSNHIDLSQIMQVLWYESASRTPLQFSAYKVIRHLITFPVKTIYDFLPWSLFSLFLLRRGTFAYVRSHPFLKYCLWLFAANVIVYWISPGTMPRYLFPLLGVWFIPMVAAAMYDSTKHNTRVYNLLVSIATGLSAVLFLTMPFNDKTGVAPYALPAAIAVSGLLFLILLIQIRLPKIWMVTMILALIATRIGFDWFILNSRLVAYLHKEKIAMDVVRITKGKPLYVYKKEIPELPNDLIHNAFSFVIEVQRQEILRVADNPDDPEAFYLVGLDELEGRDYKEYMCFSNENNDLFLVKYLRPE